MIGDALEADVATWQPLFVAPRLAKRGEFLRRMIWSAVVLCLLPPLCVLLLLPFFYRKSTAIPFSSLDFEGSRIISMPEYDEVANDWHGAKFYDWIRLEDPRQYLLPDTRAGFSYFLRFQPKYTAASFPVYHSSKPQTQPQYDELFSRIAPQFPRTIVNEQIHRFWQHQPTAKIEAGTASLQQTPGAKRPVWRLADGTAIPPSEEPVLSNDALEYWKNPQTRTNLAKIFRNEPGWTVLELQVLPSATLPRLTTAGALSDEPRIAVNRVVLRRSCGDIRLDQAAVEALRQLLDRQGSAMGTAPIGNYPLQVDWSCW